MNRDVGIFISSAFTPEEWSVINAESKKLKDNICGYCHRPVATIPINDVLKETLACRGIFYGEGFCPECSFAINYKPFLSKNFLVEGKKFQTFQHAEVWDNILTKPLNAPWFASLTTSHKKHNIFEGQVNLTDSERYVVFDKHLVKYSLTKSKDLFDSVLTEYVNFKQPKDSIMSGELVTAFLTEEEYDRLREIDMVLKAYRGSMLFKMAVTYVQKPVLKEKSVESK